MAVDITWQEITPETWRAEHGGNEALIIKDREAWRWLVNGGEMLPPVDEPGLPLETAKYAAKVVLELHPNRKPTPNECAAATTMAQGEADRARTWHEQASADLGLQPALADDLDAADTGASGFTMSQLQRRRERLVRRLDHLRQRIPERMAGADGKMMTPARYDAAEASALQTAIALFDERLQARSLAERVAARLSPKLPAETRAQLQASAEQVGSFTDAIRDFAEEDGADPGLVSTMLGEAATRGETIVDAALEVRRELQARRALAEARKKLLTEQADAARAEERAADAAIDRLDEKVIRPICLACGTGDTKAVRALTGRVSIVKNAARVELEENAIDYLDDSSGFVRITREADKKAIAAALGEGREVPGARLVQATRVEVRG